MAKEETIKIVNDYVIETDGIYCGEGCKYRDVDIGMAFQRDGCKLFGVKWLLVGGGGIKRLRCDECRRKAPVEAI